MANRSRFAGQINALDYYFGGPNPDACPPALVISTGNAAAGAATVTLNNSYTSGTDGTNFAPLATTASVLVGSGSNQETVTPSAVSNSNVYNSGTVTATFSNAHGTGDLIASATCGLQEAINYASSVGGGVVIVDARWASYGGTTAILNAATIPAGGAVTVLDNRKGEGYANTFTITVSSAEIKTLNSVGKTLLAAPGSGAMWIVEEMFIENVYGTAAYASGGAIQASYGTGTTVAATATIAATFLTSPTVKQGIGVAGAIASTAMSSLANKAITLACATGDFTTGDGTLIVKIRARLVQGLS